MASANVDGMVQAAIRAYRAGNKAEARQLLERATQLDQYNEQAWLWLSAVVETPEDQRICLENVIIINPNNENARRGLNMLSSSPKPKPAPPETSAVVDSEPAESFTAPPTATSSPSAIYNPANEVSEDEYDDWVSGLNLGGKKPDPVPSAPKSQVFEASVLDEDSYANVFSSVFDDEFDDEDAHEGIVSTKSAPVMDNSNLDELRQAAFVDDDFDDPFDDDDDLFGGSTDSGSMSGPFTSAALSYDLPQTSPPVSEASRSRPPVKASPAPDRSTGRRPGAGGLVEDGEYDSSGDLDPSIYFKAIPKQIKPTRLPGTNEPYPMGLLVSLLVLVLLNAGAAALLVISL